MHFSRWFRTPLLGAMFAMAGCSGLPSSPDQASAPSVTPSASKGSGSHSQAGAKRLVYCEPFDEASKTATIGILGGTIRVGQHSLRIPPGALLSPRTITARIVKDDYSHSVLFSPEGLQFAVPAVVTLSYAGCDKQTRLKQLGVVYTSNTLDKILALLPSINNPFNQTTTGTIEHFSRYAIAY